MKQGNFRTICIVLFLLVTLYYLSPLFLPKETDLANNTQRVVKPVSFWTDKMLKLGLDLQGGMEVTLAVDTSALQSDAELDQTVQVAVNIIQNRIDQFGVAEPNIQKVGSDKILVQLPGLTDFQRAKDLIGKTAILKFQLVAQPEREQAIVTQLDSYISQNIDSFPYLKIRALGYSEEDEGQTREPVDEADEAIDYDQAPWHENLFSYIINSGLTGGVSHDLKPVVRTLLADSLFIAGVQYNYQILPGRDESRADLPIYILLSHEAMPVAERLTGKNLTDARSQFDQSGLGSGGHHVSLRFDRDGARIFDRITHQNVGRRLAIVLDDVVYVAPVIQDRIRGGEAQITGNFTLEETNDIVIVLKAGNLPAPVHPINESIVGPMLGRESIRQGMMAGIIGVIAVMVFMVIFYKLTGLIANLALVLNTCFIFAALTFFEATLTLPGIAGIILTIGMAVDANVLIYERIKEELRNGKSIRAAIDGGYSRAIVTILDANITTLITAMVLFQFGTGAIRGFAVTLTIGILASMFTAIVVTRAIFDAMYSNPDRKTLSI